MIATANEYQKAQEELRDFEARLRRIEQSHPVGNKGFTKAGIRKMIARLHEELAVYEGSEEARMDCDGRMIQPTSAAGNDDKPID